MYYPVMLNLENKNVLVVGGGSVAYRKVKNLLKAKANITVLSEKIDEKFIDYDLNYIEDTYDEKYLKGMFLVIGATSDVLINEKISRDAKKISIISNIVDNKDISDFITPSVVDNDDLVISISTNGKYPALSKFIRKDLDGKYEKYNSEYMNLLEETREEILENHLSRKEELINKALSLNIEELREFYNKIIKDF